MDLISSTAMPTRILRMRSYFLAGTGVASASSIGVYGTGASVTTGLDNNYQIIADTTGEAITPVPTQAVLVTSLANTWAAPVADSAWIGPQADESTATIPNGCCNGSDTYETTFRLAGLNPGTADTQYRAESRRQCKHLAEWR